MDWLLELEGISFGNTLLYYFFSANRFYWSFMKCFTQEMRRICCHRDWRELCLLCDCCIYAWIGEVCEYNINGTDFQIMSILSEMWYTSNKNLERNLRTTIIYGSFLLFLIIHIHFLCFNLELIWPVKLIIVRIW